MADPISAKGLQGMSNLAGELSKAGEAGKKGTPGKFEQLRLEKQQDPIQQVDRQIENFLKTGKLEAGQPREISMAERVAAKDGIAIGQPGQIGGSQSVWRPQQVQATGGAQQLAESVKDFDAGQKRLDAIMSELQSGKKYTQEELLKLQLEVNVLAEQVSMTTKLVDSAMQSIKQVMQQQV
jgi:hypothetical protein